MSKTEAISAEIHVSSRHLHRFAKLECRQLVSLMLNGLVVGGDGLIGRALANHLANTGWKVARTTRREVRGVDECFLDLHDPVTSGSDWLKRLQVPGLVVFISAASTGYSRCAINPVETWRINVDNTIALSKAFMRHGAFVIFLSSNAVFDGNLAHPQENSPTSPVTEYGRQKAACEIGLKQAAKELSAGLAIVRLTKVIDRSQELIDGWIRDLQMGASVRAATDLVVSPVTLGYVVKGLTTLAERRLANTFHFSGYDDMTYFDLATSLAAGLGGIGRVEKDLVRPRLGNVPSPDFSALDMGLTSSLLGIKAQSLSDVTRELLHK